MTPKQKLKSIERKMQTIQRNDLQFDFELASRKFHEIEKFYKLRQEHFFLKFEIEHFDKCGKEL